MFFQKDYVLRMIEMMGDLMRRIGELMDDLTRLRLLNDACREYCGIDLEAAKKLSVESLKDLLAPQPRLMLSEILYIQTMQTSLPDEKREQLLYRSMQLLLSLREESLLCELRHERLTEYLREIHEYVTPRDLMDAASFFFQADKFSCGEDRLYEALESAAPNDYPLLLAEGEKLMEELSKLPHKRLAEGELPYPEVLESIQTLQKRHEALYTT